MRRSDLKNRWWMSLVGFVITGLILACSSSSDDVDGDQTPPDGDMETDSASDGDAPDGDADMDLEEEEAPGCGSGQYSGAFLIPGPGEEGFDAELAAKARRHDRSFHTFHAATMGLNADINVDPDDTVNRDLIYRFLHEDDSWDFESFSGGLTAEDVIRDWEKIAGLYGGMGICADAFRYAVLRDQNADCAEIEIAREQLLRSLDAMHIAFTIPGVPGVVARGFIRSDLPGFGSNVETIPLFDQNGNPLPEEKTNGEWREDNSGQYPNYVWEDSCSRDMMLGWAAASAAVTEVIQNDSSFDPQILRRIRNDASAVVKELMKVRESGYDLEFPDADGRTTYHGYLNENNLDGNYIDGLQNGFYATMALGIFGAYVYASENAEGLAYLKDELIGNRDLPRLAAEQMKFVDMGLVSNYSNYNMAFASIWLAMRYIDDSYAQEQLRIALESQLYNVPGGDRQPVEIKQSLYDFIYAAGKTKGTAFVLPSAEPDAQAVSNGLDSLREFKDAPFYDIDPQNCDEAEIESGHCVCADGTEIEVLGYVGRNGSLVADRPLPMRIRPPSNYYWRSNPYQIDGGSNGTRYIPSVDFRVAYWLGRWTTVPGE